MNICQFYKRKKWDVFRLGTGGVTGLRQTNLRSFWNMPMPRYERGLSRHLLVLMNLGAAVFRRDGETSVAEAGDVLLVEAGPGSLQFVPSRTPEGLSGLIVEFDARSVARHLRESFDAETAALAAAPFPKAGVTLHGLQARCFPPIHGVEQARFDASYTFDLLFNTYANQTASLARSVFYEARWQLLPFLEAQVWTPLSDRGWWDRYEGGAERLAKDCAFFVGCSPDAFVKRRKIELASAWLRCNHRVDEIARVLGFSSTWEFQCLFSAITKRRCADVADETPLALMSAAEFHEAISPFWWSRVRYTNGRLRSENERAFVRSLCEAERRSRQDEARLCRARTKWDLSPRKSGETSAGHVLHINAQQKSEWVMKRIPEEFLEMKTTAAEIVVPFFKDAPVRRSLAA